MESVFQYQSLLYIIGIICSQLISYYNNLLASHFGIDKTRKQIAKKYYWSILRRDVEIYIKSSDIYLPLRAICHKLYKDLQSLSVLIYSQKNLSIDFVICLSLLIDCKIDSYDTIFIIVDRLTKMVYYESVKTTIDVVNLAKVIINIVISYYGLPGSIVSDRCSLLTLRFWFLLYHFFSIKQKLSTIIYLQINS